MYLTICFHMHIHFHYNFTCSCMTDCRLKSNEWLNFVLSISQSHGKVSSFGVLTHQSLWGYLHWSLCWPITVRLLPLQSLMTDHFEVASVAVSADRSLWGFLHWGLCWPITVMLLSLEFLPTDHGEVPFFEVFAHRWLRLPSMKSLLTNHYEVAGGLLWSPYSPIIEKLPHFHSLLTNHCEVVSFWVLLERLFWHQLIAYAARGAIVHVCQHNVVKDWCGRLGVKRESID